MLYRYLVIITTLLFALPNHSSAQFLNESSQLETNQIQEIRVFGNQYIDRSVILSRLAIQEGESYHPAILQEKVAESINRLHASKLFSDIRVEIEYPNASNDIIFDFHIVEEPSLNSFKFEGNNDLAVEDLEMRVRLVEGQVFSKADVERNRQRIIEYYKEEGFLLAQVYSKQTLDPESGRTNLTFKIVEGPKVIVEEIEIQGNLVLESEDLIGVMGSTVDHWYSSGEYDENVWQSDKDSMIILYHQSGYLDAEILEHRSDYLPDLSYRFYGGRLTNEDVEIGTLFKSINEDLRNDQSGLAQVYDAHFRANNLLLRRFRQQEESQQSVTVKPFIDEEDLVHFLNRILDQEELRQLAIQVLNEERTFKNGQLNLLLKKEELSETEQRKALRLILEENYPLSRYSETINSSKVKLTSKVKEGRQYFVGKFNFIDNKVISDNALWSQVDLDSGDVFNESQYQAMLGRIYALYREDGYLFVRIDEQKSYRDSLVDISFQITEGLPASVRKVFIAGNTTTKDKVVRREIKLFPGDTYRQSLMERSFRDIMQLNYFDNVVPDVKVVGEQDVDLVFQVLEREAGTGQFTAGMAFSARDGLVGTLGLSIPNCCLGDGQRADLNIEYGGQRQNYSIGFSEPWFNDTPTSVGARANYSRFELINRDPVVRRGVSVFLGRRLTWPDDYFYIQGDAAFQENIQGDNNAGIIQRTGYEATIGASIIRDDKNLPRFPTEGSRYRTSLTYAIPFQTSSRYQDADYFNFIKSDTEIKWWFPIIGNLALGLENNLGIISGESIQFFSLYQMGGMLGFQGKMRGYDPGSIGLSRIGRSFTSFTSQLTYPIAENRFYVQAFFDAGMVYGQPFNESQDVPEEDELPAAWEEIDLTQMVRDVGFGFRVIIPMLGIIGFDFGWPLDMDRLNTIEGTNYTDEYRLNFVIEQGF